MFIVRPFTTVDGYKSDQVVDDPGENGSAYIVFEV